MYTICQISEIVGGILQARGDGNAPIRDLLYDSRKAAGKVDALFFAIKTPANDGHKYIKNACQQGVKNFVVEKSFENQINNFQQANFILVDSPLKALQKLVQYHRSRFNIPVIGITGSNGKTAVKEWLFQLLCEDKKVVYSPNSFNSQIGVPMSVWNMSEGDQLGIFEAGISRPNEMAALEAVIQPTIGIFTNIGSAHGEGFDNIDQKTAEKLQLFRHVQTLIYNADGPYIGKNLQQSDFASRIQLFSWSRTKKEVNLSVKQIDSNNHTTIMTAVYQGREIKVEIPFADKASIENAIQCWAAMLVLNYDNDIIFNRLKKLTPIAMRLEMKQGINRSLIINDTYNSDINSLQIALDLMANQRQYEKRTVVLSDILQSGSSEKNLYREVNQLLKNSRVDRLIGIGESVRRQADLFSMQKEFYATTDDFLSQFDRQTIDKEIILIKGARKYHLERIAGCLELKTHETVLEVDLSKMIANVNYYRSLIQPQVKTMAMVKAWSYGAGDVEVANALQYHGIDYLTVAYADEGATLREKNIRLPIMVMNPESKAIDALLKYQLQPEVYSFSVLEMLEDALKGNTAMDALHVHLKIDTGMHRLGFMPGELEKLVDKLKNNPRIVVESVFSHFVAADDPAEDAFTHHQAALLTQCHDYITKELGYRPMKHIANTAGLCRFPQYHFDMVRMGIGLYGICPFADSSKVVLVSTLKTVVSQLRTIAKGETVGYNRRFKTDRETTIATIPIGYADGLPRSAGYGKTDILVNRQKAKIVGSICMDMCMVDVTGMDVKEGDEVIIFGEQMPLQSLASSSGLIEYELLTSISPRVKRVYLEE